ncbi:hypothetical protein [Natrinema sp. 74]|uniref:hypothetical protein n=1 Tax=Natrinema sp. 74 TaxID=3384159 RepID=UPI0038D3E5FF
MNPSTASASGDDGSVPTSRRTFLAAAGATAAAGFMSGPASGEPATGSQSATVAVSPPHRPAVDDAMDRLTERRRRAITLDVTASTAGFRRFADREVDVLVAGRPILAAERGTVRENEGDYEARVVPTATAALRPPQSSWADPLRPSRLVEAWSTDDPVQTWAEIAPLGEADDADVRIANAQTTVDRTGDRLAGEVTPLPTDTLTLVRGVRSHQYAAGRGGVGYYEPDAEWFGRPGTTGHEAADVRLVRLSFLYADRHSLRRPEVQTLLRAYGHTSADAVGTVAFYADPHGG